MKRRSKLKSFLVGFLGTAILAYLPIQWIISIINNSPDRAIRESPLINGGAIVIVSLIIGLSISHFWKRKDKESFWLGVLIGGAFGVFAPLYLVMFFR